VYGVINAVTNVIRVFVAKGALKGSDDDADEQVLLTLAHTETFNGRSMQLRMCGLGEDRDLLDKVGVVSEFVAYSVADVLCRIVCVDRDGEVPAYGGKVRHRTVWRQIEHL
jgi:hypothetical protein